MTERERLEAELAKIQAQIDALPEVQSVIEEAQERFAVECRDGAYDTGVRMRAMVKVVQELRDAKERIAELEEELIKDQLGPRFKHLAKAVAEQVKADIAELEARDAVASEPALLDPKKPLEAYYVAQS